MLTTELTSRKIYEAMKAQGHKCDLLVIFEKPFEDAVVEVIEDGKIWSISGVIYVEDNVDAEVKADMGANLCLKFNATLVFNNHDEMSAMVDKLRGQLITHMEEPMNDDGSVPTTFYKQVPLIVGDEVAMSSVIQQFEAFKSTVLTAVG